jgi:IS1 family transposase/transposase-like protein
LKTCHCCNGEARYFANFKNKNRIVRRFRCVRCNKTFSEPQPLDGLRIETEKVNQVVRLLCEGVGVRAASRLSGLDKETILSILETVGEKCARFHDEAVRNVPTTNVETDELYSYVFCKQEHNKTRDVERGDQYTFLSFCRDSKLLISFNVGKRTREISHEHLGDLKGRIANRIQLSTDNFHCYRGKRGAICSTFGKDGVDYGMLTKVYAKSLQAKNRFAQPVCILAKKTPILGEPDRDLICTSHVERQNLNIRLFNRRFTRLTLGYSKKLANLKHSVALFVCYWNWCWKHTTTSKTPAQGSGLTDHVWTVNELINAVSKA